MRTGAVALVGLVLVAGLTLAPRANTIVGPGLVLVDARVVRSNTGPNPMTTFTIHTRAGKRIGWGVQVCHHVGTGGVLGDDGTDVCQGTYSLPRGRIMSQGARRSEFSYLGAVTGGTGIYSNVGGTLFVQRTGARTQRLLFSLESF